MEKFKYISPSQDSVNRNETNTQLAQIVSVTKYGVNGDGTDETEKIQQALNAETSLYFPPTTNGYLVEHVTTGVCKYICGRNTKIKHKKDTVIGLLNISSSDIIIDSIYFQGADSDSTLPLNDNGLVTIGTQGVVGKNSVKVINCTFDGFLNSGLVVSQLDNRNSSFQVTNCTFKNNAYGYISDTYGEYATFSNCHFYSNEIGVSVKGGNNVFTGCTIDQNVKGIQLLSGSNDGHGIFNGCNINHNTEYGIYIPSGLGNGFSFIGCHIYESPIYIYNTNTNFPITFDGCVLDPEYLTINNSRVHFNNNYFDNINFTTASLTIASNAIIEASNNKFKSDTFNLAPYNLNGGSIKKTFSSNTAMTAKTTLLNPNTTAYDYAPFKTTGGNSYSAGAFLKTSWDNKPVIFEALIKFTMTASAGNIPDSTFLNPLLVVQGDGGNFPAIYVPIYNYGGGLYFAYVCRTVNVPKGANIKLVFSVPKDYVTTILNDESFIRVDNL